MSVLKKHNPKQIHAPGMNSNQMRGDHNEREEGSEAEEGGGMAGQTYGDVCRGSRWEERTESRRGSERTQCWHHLSSWGEEPVGRHVPRLFRMQSPVQQREEDVIEVERGAENAERDSPPRSQTRPALETLPPPARHSRFLTPCWRLP